MGVTDIMMILGPNVGFILQYVDIVRSRDPSGFSNQVCLVLILANVLRIFWWALDASLSATVLWAAILALICQVTLLELTVRLTAKKAGVKDRLLEWRQFWGWQHFSTYAKAILGFTAVVLMSILIVNGPLLIWPISFFSSLFEAQLAVPQLIKNYKRKSTVGLSVILVLMWVGGDSFKAYFYIAESQPIALVCVAGYQLITDCLVMAQVLSY